MPHRQPFQLLQVWAPHVRALDAPIADWRTCLTANERHDIERAIERRQFEYATGRKLAKEIISALTQPQAADPNALELRNDASRAPQWPAAIWGSITHTHGYCVVAATQKSHAISVGIDLERARVLDAKVAEHIATAAELSLCAEALAHVGLHTSLSAVVLFSAKEAFYKAQHPLSKTFLGFHDVTATAVRQAKLGLVVQLRIEGNVPVLRCSTAEIHCAAPITSGDMMVFSYCGLST